jgi:hypothetical protein
MMAEPHPANGQRVIAAIDPPHAASIATAGPR